ncbi:GntR family transcriptional regulator [Lacticaseibacillus yichunensis]|uniref:GntR family transcriptional regulator n=1 Tax=Lacticaseibacillus yichunensis TaxID=2486015 RepID=A0ABW4CTS1_9LACO|nr:GntR family transcriptional regulator [Lacticaseibacillus yichunensis]
MNRGSSKPLYEQIYEDLKDKINDNTYPINTLLPTEKELTGLYNVSRITIQKAVNLLAAEDMVTRHAGVGTTVIHQERLPSSNRLIGLVMSGISDSFGRRLVESITDACNLAGYSLIIKFSHESQRKEQACIQALLDIPVQGILIAPLEKTFFDPLLMQKILDGMPIVVLDKQFTGIDSLFVGTDHTSGAEQAAQLIAGMGHRNIAFFGYDRIANSSLETRENAFVYVYSQTNHPLRAAAFAHIVQSHYFQHDEAALQEDIKRIRNFIATKRPTCVVAIDNYVASLTREAIKELHLDIPKDICLFGFDSDSSAFPSLRYTYLAQDEEMIGKTAFTMLSDYITNKRVAVKKQLIPPAIVDYGSVIRASEMIRA